MSTVGRRTGTEDRERGHSTQTDRLVGGPGRGC